MNGINPVEIARRMAAALHASTELAAEVATHFKNAMTVYMDSIGALQGADPTTIAEHLAACSLSSLYPLVIVGALQHDDGPVATADECQVGMILIIDSAVDSQGNKINSAIPLRAADGVFEVGRADALVAIVEAMKSALMLSSTNGIIHTFSAAYNAGEQYPIQSATLTVSASAVNAF